MKRSSRNYAKVSPKGWLVIPADLRKRHGIEPGSFVIFDETENGIIIRPLPKDPIEALAGLLQKDNGFTGILLEKIKHRSAEEEEE